MLTLTVYLTAASFYHYGVLTYACWCYSAILTQKHDNSSCQLVALTPSIKPILTYVAVCLWTCAYAYIWKKTFPGRLYGY